MNYANASPVLVAAMIGSTFLIFADERASAQEWRQYKNVEQAGWSVPELDKARQFAASIGSAAIMIVDHGKVVQAWGAIDHPYSSASVRKSIYDATIGATHTVKPFDINTSLGALGIDDIDPLDQVELSATFEQLLTARSGVYHPCAYETPSNARLPPSRHSAKPGTRWYYNNWDFNVVCAAFEQLSGERMQQAFANRIAKPLGMQDF